MSPKNCLSRDGRARDRTTDGGARSHRRLRVLGDVLDRTRHATGGHQVHDTNDQHELLKHDEELRTRAGRADVSEADRALHGGAKVESIQRRRRVGETREIGTSGTREQKVQDSEDDDRDQVEADGSSERRHGLYINTQKFFLHV